MKGSQSLKMRWKCLILELRRTEAQVLNAIVQLLRIISRDFNFDLIINGNVVRLTKSYYSYLDYRTFLKGLHYH